MGLVAGRLQEGNREAAGWGGSEVAILISEYHNFRITHKIRDIQRLSKVCITMAVTARGNRKVLAVRTAAGLGD